MKPFIDYFKFLKCLSNRNYIMILNILTDLDARGNELSVFKIQVNICKNKKRLLGIFI